MFKISQAIATGIVLIFFAAGCGGSSSGSSDPAFVGTWRLATDNGKTPDQLGYDSGNTITSSTYTAWLEWKSYRCDWDGTITYTDTTLTFYPVNITGDCAQASREPTTGNWSVSDDNQTFTSDARSTGGSLTTWTRQ